MSKDIKLGTKNLFRINRMINKAGLFDTISEAMEDISSAEDGQLAQFKTGVLIFRAISELADKSEDELYELVADLEGITIEEVEERDFMDTVETIESIIRSDRVMGFIKKFNA